MNGSRSEPNLVASSAPNFSPINRRSLADDVRRQLERNIRTGVFAPGAMLPDEQTLCRQLGVSRPSVREAIRDVIAVGLVERRGNRVHVVEHLPAVRLPTDERAARIREVFETRRLIEVQITEYAAERATAAQRGEISDYAQLIGDVTDVEQLRPLDRAFHAVIAAAAGNALLAELHSKVLDAVFATESAAALLGRATNRADAKRILSNSATTHRANAVAIASGDIVAASAAARAHLDDVEHRIATEPGPLP